MYIPSIFKSLQQITCTPGNNTMAATDINYTELAITVASCNSTGFASPFYLVDQNSPTNLNLAVVGANPGQLSPVNVQVVVKEYVPFFFRRPFYHNLIEIPTQQYTGYLNTGIAFGPKAYAVSRGWYYTFNRNGTPLEISDAQIWSDLKLPVPSNGQLVSTRRQLDYLNSYNDPDPPTIRQGSLYHYFTIVDPW